MGATVLRLMRAKLLTPITVAVSSGSTISVARDCLMGIVNIMAILIATMKTTASGNQVESEKATASAAETILEATIVFMSPNLSTTMGTSM